MAIKSDPVLSFFANTPPACLVVNLLEIHIHVETIYYRTSLQLVLVACLQIESINTSREQIYIKLHTHTDINASEM